MKNLFSVVRALRIPEVILVSGAYLFAGVLIEWQLDIETIRFLAGWPAAFWALLCIWNLNSFADYRHDTQNPRFQEAQLRRRGVYLLVAVAAGLCGAAIAAPEARWVVAALILAGAFYSAPSIGGKHVPVWGSALHVALAWLLVRLSATMLGAPQWAEVAPTVLLSALLVSGHFVQELCDESADRASGIRTFPATFGSRATLVLAMIAPGFATLFVARFPFPANVVLATALVAHTAAIGASAFKQTPNVELRYERLRTAYRIIWVTAATALVVLRWR